MARSSALPERRHLRKGSFDELRSEVISQGLCTGCGTCVGVCPWGLLKMEYPLGEPEPCLGNAPCRDCGYCLSECPGKDIPLADMEQMTFGQTRDPNANRTGVMLRCYGAHAVDERIRKMASTGGTVTAMLAWALDSKVVEAVIVAGFDDANPYRQQPKLVTDSRELVKHARSKHGGAVPNNALLWEAAYDRNFSSIGLVGLPCHIHGLRKIQLAGEPKRVASAVKFAFGLFCGVNHYFEGTRHLLREWCRVESLDEVAQLDYRWGGWPGYFYVRAKDGREVRIDRQQFMRSFLSSIYPRDRCQLCLDYTAELADVSFGEWRKELQPAGSPGWNMIVARTQVGVDMVEQAARDGYIHVEAADVSERPMWGDEAKKHANAYRWNLRNRHHLPVPDYGFVPRHEPEEMPESVLRASFAVSYVQPEK